MDWPTAEKQVKGFPGAKYKSFPSESEARAWLDDPVYNKKNGSGKSAGKNGKQPIILLDADPEKIVVYTDGGSINNPGPGGYGVVIVEARKVRELSGGFRLTTNNRMEMMAAIVALRELQDRKKQIDLFSDSSYLVNGINKGWVKKWSTRGWKKADGQDVLNIDLWQELLSLTENVNVSFNWVKGHAGHEGNERCDKLAVASARLSGLPVDVEYESVE
jgi:ribonuclease HI